MISTLQFQASQEVKHGTSENLVEGMVNQTFQMINDVKWADAIDKKWVKKTMQLLSVGIVLFLLAGIISHTSFLVFFYRLFSLEARYPTKTKIVDVSFDNLFQGGQPGVLRIPEGDKIFVKVKADGEIPPYGKINVITDSGGETNYDLKFDEKKSIFFSELDPILENIKITVFLGDDLWGPKKILVILRPKIMTFNATITPPKYTKLEVSKEQTGNLQAFEGSTVDFLIKSA